MPLSKTALAVLATGAVADVAPDASCRKKVSLPPGPSNGTGKAAHHQAPLIAFAEVNAGTNPCTRGQHSKLTD